MAMPGPADSGMPGLGRVDVRLLVERVHQLGDLDRAGAALG
jgi:hypothetical protein